MDGRVTNAGVCGHIPEPLNQKSIRTGWNDRQHNTSLLVLDSYRGHTSEAVSTPQFVEENIKTAIIPGGCTSKVQPLDVLVSINDCCPMGNPK